MTDFIAPGMVIALAFAQSMGLTALSMVVSKKEGTLDRQWAAGVKPSEVMITHIWTQLIMLSVQVGLLLAVALGVFGIPCQGNLLVVFVLTVLLGLAGMFYGLFLSSICANESECVQYSVGSFFPVILLSGILWPIEAIPGCLQYVAAALPTTWAATALRDVLARGWDWTRPSVWQGVAVVVGWSALFLLLSTRGLRSRD